MPRSCAPTISIGMLLLFFAQLVEVGAAGLVFGDPLLRELAGLNVSQRLLHRLPGRVANHLLAARQVAVFGGVGDRIAHAVEPTFVNQVDDQLHFVQAFEISNLGCVARFHQRFESLLDERSQAAAEDRLLAEQVALSFFLESGLQHAGAGRSDAMCVCETEFVSVSAGILMDRQQRWHTAAFAINAADQMSRALGSDHHHVNVGRRNDRLEMNAESMRNAQNLSGMQIGLDGLFVQLALRLVGREQVNPVGALGGLIGSHDNHAVGPRLLRALARRIEADNDLKTAVAEILGLRVSLAAIANNGDCLALQRLGPRVAFVENGDHRIAPLRTVGR